MPQEICASPHDALRAHCLLRRLPAHPAKSFQSLSSSMLHFTVFAHFCKTVEVIPLSITDPSVHLKSPVVSVAENLLHILVQAFCVQLTSREHQRLLRLLLPSTSMYFIFASAAFVLIGRTWTGHCLHCLPSSIRHRDLWCAPFHVPPGNTTGVRST